jgi:hypothetical protein
MSSPRTPERRPEGKESRSGTSASATTISSTCGAKPACAKDEDEDEDEGGDEDGIEGEGEGEGAAEEPPGPHGHGHGKGSGADAVMSNYDMLLDAGIRIAAVAAGDRHSTGGTDSSCSANGSGGGSRHSNAVGGLGDAMEAGLGLEDPSSSASRGSGSSSNRGAGAGAAARKRNRDP